MKEEDLEMYEWIDRFLENDLSASEQKKFEARLLSDSDFQKEFDTQKELFDAMNEHASLLSIKEEVRSAETRVLPKEKRKISLQTLILSVSSVAAVVFLVTFFGLNYLNQNKISDSQVAYQELSGEVQALQERQEDLWEVFRNDKKKGLDFRFGTAIFIKDSFYLTNKHLVKESERIKINGWQAEMYKVDSASDLALVKIVDSNFVMPKQFYGFGGGKKRLATDVFTLGFPKEDVVYKPGVITCLTGNRGDTTQLEINTELNEGNSGSPIINDEGYLIGLVTGKSKTQRGAGYAIKEEIIHSFLERSELEIKRESLLRKKSRTRQVELVSENVARVIVY